MKKISKTKKQTILAKFNSGVSALELGRKYGVHYTTIYTWSKKENPTKTSSVMKTIGKVSSTTKKATPKANQSSTTNLTSLRKENLKLKSAYNTLVSKVREVYTLVS